MGKYISGNLIRLTGWFKDENNNFADPTTVVVEVTSPDGSTASYTPTRTTTGTYIYDLVPTVRGSYTYSFKGSGALIAVGLNRFVIS